jgi:hypothetical protein
VQPASAVQQSGARRGHPRAFTTTGGSAPGAARARVLSALEGLLADRDEVGAAPAPGLPQRCPVDAQSSSRPLLRTHPLPLRRVCRRGPKISFTQLRWCHADGVAHVASRCSGVRRCARSRGVRRRWPAGCWRCRLPRPPSLLRWDGQPDSSAEHAYVPHCCRRAALPGLCLPCRPLCLQGSWGRAGKALFSAIPLQARQEALSLMTTLLELRVGDSVALACKGPLNARLATGN